jgi:hypothetical protein
MLPCMPKKKPQQRRDAERKLRAKIRDRSASLRSSRLEDDTPPPEAVEVYVQVFEWAAQNPDAAEDLACFVESDWVGPMAGLAYPERFNFPEEQQRDVAWKFRAWHVLNGLKYTLDWPKPVAAMSEDEIIAQLRADGLAGRITLGDR